MRGIIFAILLDLLMFGSGIMGAGWRCLCAGDYQWGGISFFAFGLAWLWDFNVAVCMCEHACNA
jgi:putative copper export protein